MDVGAGAGVSLDCVLHHQLCPPPAPALVLASCCSPFPDVWCCCFLLPARPVALRILQAEFTASEFFEGGDASAMCSFIDQLSQSVAAMDVGLQTLAELATPLEAIIETIDYDIACHDCNQPYAKADAAEAGHGGGGDVEYMAAMDPNDPRNRPVEPPPPTSFCSRTLMGCSRRRTLSVCSRRRTLSVFSRGGSPAAAFGLLFVLTRAALMPPLCFRRVLEELLVTEQQFGAALRLIAEKFQFPMSQLSAVVPAADVAALFGDVDALYQAHLGFLGALEAEMQSTSGRCVSRALLDAVEPWRCYALFCCKLPAAMAKYDELYAVPATKEVLERCRTGSGQLFSLRELLNTPMQRVLKYPLLAKQLFRGTPVAHEDKPGLGRAVSAIIGLCCWINTTKTQYDAVVALQSTFDGYPAAAAQPSLPELGFLCAEGDLYYAAQPTASPSLHRGFLLDGALLLCRRGKSKKKQLVYAATVDLRNTSASVSATGDGGGDGKAAGKRAAGKPGKGGAAEPVLSLTVGGTTSHVFFFASGVERDRWAAALKNCIAAMAEEEYFGSGGGSGSGGGRKRAVGRLGQSARSKMFQHGAAVAPGHPGLGEAAPASTVAAGNNPGSDSDSDSDRSEEDEDAVPYSEFAPKNLRVPITRAFNKKKAYMMFTPKSKQGKGGGSK